MSTSESTAASVARLKRTIADLNDTSPECLSALDGIRIIELETELQQAQAALAAVTLERDEAKARAAMFYDPNVLHAHCVRNLRDGQVAHLFGERMTVIQNDRTQLISDRDQLQAQVGALRGALERWAMRSTRMSSQEVHELYQESRDLLSQPAPAAPDSAKDTP